MKITVIDQSREYIPITFECWANELTNVWRINQKYSYKLFGLRFSSREKAKLFIKDWRG